LPIFDFVDLALKTLESGAMLREAIVVAFNLRFFRQGQRASRLRSSSFPRCSGVPVANVCLQ
jgi:hypothetical protein